MKKISADNRYVLVKGRDNYADEFDVHFVAVMTADEWKEIDSTVRALFEELEDKAPEPEFEWQELVEVEHCFGTNESLVFHGYKDWRKKLTVKEIDSAAAAIIVENIGWSFGINFADDGFIEQLKCYTNEDDDE